MPEMPVATYVAVVHPDLAVSLAPVREQVDHMASGVLLCLVRCLAAPVASGHQLGPIPLTVYP